MAYNISALPVFQTEGRAFVMKAILESQTLKELDFDTNAKGNQSVQLLNTDIVISDGTACGRSANGGATLTQAILSVKPLKINQDYCVRTLEKTWAKGELAKGQEYDSMAFMNEIGELNRKATALEIENMVWKGDVTLTGATNLKQIDGFIKQIKAGSYINLQTVATGSTVTAKLQKAVAAMPIEESGSEDFYIWIGQDTFNQYVAELAEKNLFHEQAKDTLFGTINKLKVVNGLNGGHVVLTRKQHLAAGGEMTDVEFKHYYDYPTDTQMFDSRFSLGVVPVYVDRIGYAKF